VFGYDYRQIFRCHTIDLEFAVAFEFYPAFTVDRMSRTNRIAPRQQQHREQKINHGARHQLFQLVSPGFISLAYHQARTVPLK
jgi:hypothetical protein